MPAKVGAMSDRKLRSNTCLAAAMRIHKFILIFVAVVTLIGCAHQSENSSSHHRIRWLNERANDQHLPKEQRMQAVFALFRDYLKTGFTESDVRAVLMNTKWLAESEIHLCTDVVGRIPIELTERDSAYSLVLFPATDRDNWAIYFRLSGGSMRPTSQAFAFLRGETKWGESIRVVEYALCSALYSEERFGPSITQKK